jgi:hypothetical protein
MTRDFTLEKYDQLCKAILRLDCPVMTVRDFLAAGQPEDLSIVLRHDVDRGMGAALRMAELEADCGIAATYYVRATPGVFKPWALTRLHELGHEVGYHYEVLAKARGDSKRAMALFRRELKRFRQIVPVDTISMHGSPLSPWNNLDVWETHDFKDHDVVGDAMSSIDGENVYYFTDTGRSWDGGCYNLRDHMVSRESLRPVQTTDGLIAFLEQSPQAAVYLSAHPNRWGATVPEWVVGWVADWVINWGKVTMRELYRLLGAS